MLTNGLRTPNAQLGVLVTYLPLDSITDSVTDSVNYPLIICTFLMYIYHLNSIDLQLSRSFNSSTLQSLYKIIGAEGFSIAIVLTFALVGSYTIVVAIAKYILLN